MVTPNPPIRPTRGPFDVDLVSLYPEREAALTERLKKLMEWFLHTVAFGTDRDGRPVRKSAFHVILLRKMMQSLKASKKSSVECYF